MASDRLAQKTKYGWLYSGLFNLYTFWEATEIYFIAVYSSTVTRLIVFQSRLSRVLYYNYCFMNQMYFNKLALSLTEY